MRGRNPAPPPLRARTAPALIQAPPTHDGPGTRQAPSKRSQAARKTRGFGSPVDPTPQAGSKIKFHRLSSSATSFLTFIATRMPSP